MSAHGVPFLLLFGASGHDAGDLSADLSSLRVCAPASDVERSAVWSPRSTERSSSTAFLSPLGCPQAGMSG